MPVAPHMFMGGDASDYEVLVGRAGTYCTKHVITGKSIQSVAPGEQPMLPAAVALGILNLGVNIYRAYEARKARQELTAMAADMRLAFSHTERLLERQSEMLAILTDGQHALSQRLSLLHESLEHGFSAVQARLLDQEARRQRDEFGERTRKLLNLQRDFASTLAAGGMPSQAQLSRTIDAAEDVRAWTENKLRTSQPGDPARLPWMVATGLACRVLVDARQLEARDAALNPWQIDEFITSLRAEASALCAGRSVYDVGTSLHDVLEQYVLLYRAFTTQHETLLLQSGEVVDAVPASSLQWDDGLDDLRAVLSRPPEARAMTVSQKFELKTIADYQWYCNWAERDCKTFDVHQVRELSVRDLFSRFGYDPGLDERVAASDIPLLRQLGLGNLSAAVGARIQAALGLEKPPVLVARAPSPTPARVPQPDHAKDQKPRTMTLGAILRDARRISILDVRVETFDATLSLDIRRNDSGFGFVAAMLEATGKVIAKFSVEEGSESKTLYLHSPVDLDRRRDKLPTTISIAFVRDGSTLRKADLEMTFDSGYPRFWQSPVKVTF